MAVLFPAPVDPSRQMIFFFFTTSTFSSPTSKCVFRFSRSMIFFNSSRYCSCFFCLRIFY